MRFPPFPPAPFPPCCFSRKDYLQNMVHPDGLVLCYYGDDFTGSTDVMESLSFAGVKTVLFMAPPTAEQFALFDGVRAVGVAGRTRSMSTQEMVRELVPVFTAFRELDTPIVHYKTSSTFDSSPEVGSIGQAIDLGLSVFGGPFVPLVVGAPVLKRYCVFGNLFARSGLDSDVFRLDRHSTMRHHPIGYCCDVRIALECFVVVKLAGNLTEEQWKQVIDSLDAQDKCVEDADGQRCTKLDADFHLMLCSFLGNRCIANAIYDGDGVGAVALVEAHLTYGKQILVAR